VTITFDSIATKYLRVLLKPGHGRADNMPSKGGDHIARHPTPDRRPDPGRGRRAVNVVLLERILEQDGYRNVKSLTDPSEVVALYDQFEPDLVLLDLHMPKLDGFAVMKLLEDRISSDTFLPILILTADIRPEIKRRALSAGAKDFVTKPFDRTEVLLRIQNLLETRFLHLRMRHDAVPEGQAT
jgi:CheY-like chemotaxis protein